ncbi:MAG: LytTR family DNA-binding domain-containing protein [Owenweeksia sp.]
MYRVLIIEDEAPALQRLMNLVQEYNAGLEIAGTAGSIKQAVKWLEKHPEPELLLMDIQLSDGLSTEIFSQHHIKCPVIFITAFDSFLVQAFEYHCIDYVLKPVKQERLNSALDKYFHLKEHFEGKLSELARKLHGESGSSYVQRLLVSRGMEQFSLKVSDVAYFYSEHKVVFAVGKEGIRYLTDKTLTALQEELEPSLFYRINRKYLVHVEGIGSLRQAGKGRLEIKLNPPVEDEVVVSQPNAAALKNWLEK